MEKLVYVLWPREGDAEPDLLARLRDDVAPRLAALGVGRLTLHGVDEEARSVAAARLTRLDPPPAGMVSFWLDAVDERGPCETLLAGASARLAGYQVAESVPLAGPDAATPGERTPGIVMVALLSRPARLGRGEWLRIWQEDHRQVALETQCTHLYVRNAVVRALTEDAPAWEGIVEEGFPTAAVTDPARWYRAEGDPAILRANLGRMVESCKRFLDLDRVESHPWSEIRMAG